jgi:hypothetical protein
MEEDFQTFEILNSAVSKKYHYIDNVVFYKLQIFRPKYGVVWAQQ